jgi:hypothetical protein
MAHVGQLTSGYDAVNRTRYDPHPFTMNDTMLGGQLSLSALFQSEKCG